MYVSAFVLGFHGCDESVGEKILAGQEHLKASDNKYDWLGEGIYFWENSPSRALHWANFIKSNPKLFKGKVTKPFVIGAIIDLGVCLDLSEAASLKYVKSGHASLKELFEFVGIPMPENKRGGSRDEDLVLRHLDCAVINHVHELREKAELPAYDTVRGVFLEGEPLYEGGRIMEKTHIQVCVRDKRSIRGYFRPIPESA